MPFIPYHIYRSNMHKIILYMKISTVGHLDALSNSHPLSFFFSMMELFHSLYGSSTSEVIIFGPFKNHDSKCVIIFNGNRYELVWDPILGDYIHRCFCCKYFNHYISFFEIEYQSKMGTWDKIYLLFRAKLGISKCYIID